MSVAPTRRGRGRRGLALLAVAGLALGLPACRPQADPPRRPLRVARSLGPSTVSLLAAERRNYFADLGVEVEWLHLVRPSAALPSVAEGHVDVVVGLVSSALFNVIGRGARVRIVADRGHHPVDGCFGAVLTRADLDPNRLPRRLRIVAQPSYIPEFLVDRLRQSLGASAEDWGLVDLSDTAEPMALATGAVDVVLAQEPALSRLLETGLARVWKKYGEVVPGMQYYVLVFGPRLLDQERELGARFVAAYLRAERQIAAGKTEANVALMAEEFNIDPGLARRMCWPSVRPDLAVDTRSLADYQAWAVERGFADRVVPVAEYWDGEFAREAARILDGPQRRVR